MRQLVEGSAFTAFDDDDLGTLLEPLERMVGGDLASHPLEGGAAAAVALHPAKGRQAEGTVGETSQQLTQQ